MPFGSYNNTLDDVLSNPSAEISWMARNKTNPGGWDEVSLYGIENFNSVFAGIVLQLYLKKIKVGIAISRVVTLDAVIAYNKSQTDFRKKISFITTELEAEYANNNCSIAEYRTWIPQWYSKCKANGLNMYIYEGWNYQYDVSVGNCDGFWLHAYRTSTQMATPDDVYKYMAFAGTPDRLPAIVAEAKKKGVIVSISLLTSSQAKYAGEYYRTRPLGAAFTAAKESATRLATQDIKDWTTFDGEVVFTSKETHLIKP